MADEPKANGADTPAAAPQSQAQSQAPGVQMRLLGQYLKDLSFESPNAPEVLTKLREKPEMKIDMNTRNRKVDQGFEVELTMKAVCSYADIQGYVVEVTYAAVVAVAQEATDQVKAVLLNVEMPQLLFPYIRSLMSDLTAQGSFPPLVMQPLDFRQAFVKRLQQEAAKAQKQ